MLPADDGHVRRKMSSLSPGLTHARKGERPGGGAPRRKPCSLSHLAIYLERTVTAGKEWSGREESGDFGAPKALTQTQRKSGSKPERYS